jgi:hypothetical protein
MVHTGTEHSAAIVSNALSEPYLLRLALDEGAPSSPPTSARPTPSIRPPRISFLTCKR